MDNSTTVQYAGLIHQLVMKARSTIRDVDPQNDLTFLRIRSKKNEIMIAPGKRTSKPGGGRCPSPTGVESWRVGWDSDLGVLRFRATVLGSTTDGNSLTRSHP